MMLRRIKFDEILRYFFGICSLGAGEQESLNYGEKNINKVVFRDVPGSFVSFKYWTVIDLILCSKIQ